MTETLRYNKEGTCFDNALPIGNGQLGAMVYGRCEDDKLSLNHDTVWSGTMEKVYKDTAYDAYTKAKELFLEDNITEAQDTLIKGFHSGWVQSYLPMSDLYIKNDCGTVTDYYRELSLKDAVVNVSYKTQNNSFTKQYFISEPDNALIIKIKCENPEKFEIGMDSFQRFDIYCENDTLILNGKCASCQMPNDHLTDTENPVSYCDEHISFTNAIKAVSDGFVYTGGSRLYIKGATEVTLYFCCETSFVAFDKRPCKETLNTCLKRLEKLSKISFDEILKKHIIDYQSLYNRASIDLGGNSENDFTNELLMNKKDYKALCELWFNYGRYLLISSSRPGTQAANLQGIWNDKFMPAWCSSYAVNINTEMNYWLANMCNLNELTEPFIKFVENMCASGEEVAKKYYHADGFVCHHFTDIWAKATPVGENHKNSTSYAFWNMSGGWLSNELYNIYEYNQDIELLKNKIYPIVEKAVIFYLSQLTLYKGKYVMLLSTSPENRYIKDESVYGVAAYTTMSQTILYKLFKNYIKICNILNIENEYEKEVKEKVELLDTFEIGSDGRLLEWDEDYEEVEPHHRHVSHLYGVYPAEVFTKESKPDLFNASKESLKMRGDDGTGWAIAWKASLWATFGDGDRALKLIKRSLKLTDEKWIVVVDAGGVYENMLGAHPPFQIDSNFGLTATIVNLFMQCSDGKIKLLPALPTEFKTGNVKGLVAKGNILVDIYWEEGKLTKAVFTSKTDKIIKLELDNKIYELSLKANVQTEFKI